MSEANTTATSSHNIRQTLQDAGATTRTKPGTKSSNAKPTLSLFSLEGRDDVGTSFGEEGLGVFSASWMSGVGSHSPPLSREKGGYIPVVGDVENKQEREESAKKQGPPEDEDREAKKETGKKLHECNTKSRIQAGKIEKLG